jgi:hypothetical protein
MSLTVFTHQEDNTHERERMLKTVFTELNMKYQIKQIFQFYMSSSSIICSTFRIVVSSLILTNCFNRTEYGTYIK